MMRDAGIFLQNWNLEVEKRFTKRLDTPEQRIAMDALYILRELSPEVQQIIVDSLDFVIERNAMKGRG